jgi:hypothetical protein
MIFIFIRIITIFKINTENYEIEKACIDAILEDEEEKALILGLERSCGF